PSPTANRIATITVGITKNATSVRVLPKLCGPTASSRRRLWNRHTDHSSSPSTSMNTGAAMIVMITYSPWTFWPWTVAPGWAHPVARKAKSRTPVAEAQCRPAPVFRAPSPTPWRAVLASLPAEPATRNGGLFSARHGELEHHPSTGVRVPLAPTQVSRLPARDRVGARRQEQPLHDAGPGVGRAEVTADVEPLILGTRARSGVRRALGVVDDVLGGLPRGQRDRDHLVGDRKRLPVLEHELMNARFERGRHAVVPELLDEDCRGLGARRAHGAGCPDQNQGGD